MITAFREDGKQIEVDSIEELFSLAFSNERTYKVYLNESSDCAYVTGNNFLSHSMVQLHPNQGVFDV